MSTDITVSLSNTLRDRAQVWAEQTGRSLSDFLAETIELSLLPLGAPPDPADTWSDDEVLQAGEDFFSPDDDRRLSDLLVLQRETAIDLPQRAELARLMQQYQERLRKAIALQEAVRRGLRVPTNKSRIHTPMRMIAKSAATLCGPPMFTASLGIPRTQREFKKARLMSTLPKPVAAILVAFLFAPFAAAAPIVTFTESTMVRTQLQGVGTYRVLDFFYSSTPGADFTNYTLDVTATTGTLHDPARLQDDRQTNPAAAGQDGNTAGAVDTWANSVMSSAAKIDGGFSSNILADPIGYAPTGSGLSPGFTRIKWDVFDNVQFDDNNLNDHPEGPFSAIAPYHIARVLASTNASGTFTFTAYDTSNPGVGTVFTPGLGGWGGIPNTPPTLDPEPAYADPDVIQGDIVTTVFTATDAQSLSSALTFSNAQLASFIPYFPVGPANPTFNGTVDSAGNFIWDTTGFRSGVYTINVVATDPQGASSMPGGNFVVRFFIPEPSTATLCGLALGLASGLFRRRRNLLLEPLIVANGGYSV